MKYCPNCGTELRPEAKFCPKCGFNLEEGTSTQEEFFDQRVVQKFNQMKTDDDFELKLEKADGLNVTRAEIKKCAQEKLSGRYGEWFKTIILLIVAQFLANWLFRVSLTRFFMMGVTDLFYSLLRGYGSYYNYGYASPYSGFSRLVWFFVMIVSLILFFLIASLSSAVLQWCAINSLRGQRADGLKIFTYFVKAQKNRVLKANVLIATYTFFWSLLFIIPGIVKTASYAMTNYLLEKDSEMSASDAILLSRQIMHGYKLEFLILRVSFFFWIVLSILQFPNFYVLPYQNVTEIQFLEMLYEHYVERSQGLSVK